ncbi:hypothetical protein [Saccharopolyspora shandongensis]|uniref:hypothetical protein n=1 Tax=Saccharopolyspora shandongensis TaxID=418495 RepID=UPI0033FA7A53
MACQAKGAFHAFDVVVEEDASFWRFDPHFAAVAIDAANLVGHPELSLGKI